MSDRIQTKWHGSRAGLGNWVERRKIHFQNVLRLIKINDTWCIILRWLKAKEFSIETLELFKAKPGTVALKFFL